MQLSNILFVGLALTGANALPTSDTTPNTLESRAVCKRIFPQPKVFTCDGQGYIKDVSSKLGDELTVLTVEDCADQCRNTPGCTSIRFRWGACQRWSGDFSKMGFWPTQSFSWWYQMECFRC